MLLAATWTWTIATVSCKLAVLTFYNLIFTTRRFLLVSYTMMGLCVSFLIVFISIFMTQCKPIAASWKPALGHCRPIQHQELASVSINMVLDLLIVLLPMPIIWRLQMRLSKKIELTVLFSIGLLSVWRHKNLTPYGESWLIVRSEL